MAPSRESAAQPGHLLALDGVRGIAILTVVAGHLFISNNVSASPIVQMMLQIRDLLWVGVTLFFALSGFLITGILYDTLGAKHYFRTFYIRRALRIFPLYYGVLLVLIALTKPLHLNWHGELWRILTYTPNIPFTLERINPPAPYLNLRHFWSLAVEEQFYLLWPFAVFVLRTWKRVFAAAIAGSVLALSFRAWLVFGGWGPPNHTLPGCMDALLLGGALALLVRSRYRDAVLRSGVYVFVAATATTLAQAFTHRHFDWWSSTYLSTIGMTILALGMSGLVAASLNVGSRVQRFCSSSVLRFFGRYSYGLYIYHYSVDAALTMPLRHYLESHGVSKVPAIFGGAAVVMSISVAISVLSYHLYEEKFLQLKRYVPNARHIRTADLKSGGSR